jgi:hypothetical protein
MFTDSRALQGLPLPASCARPYIAFLSSSTEAALSPSSPPIKTQVLLQGGLGPHPRSPGSQMVVATLGFSASPCFLARVPHLLSQACSPLHPKPHPSSPHPGSGILR